MIIQKCKEIFKKSSNASIAKDQSAYMKNLFPFWGLKTPIRRELQKDIFKNIQIKSQNQLEEIILNFWNLDQREFQYAALDLAVKNRKFLTDISFLKKLISTKSWWDTVDLIASNLVGYAIEKNQSLIAHMDLWSQSENIWIKRTAIIFQLKYKENTDEKRLFEYVLQNAQDKEFFIKKAIGWALREYAKTNPISVKNFVFKNKSNLSSLSIKEALKNL